MEAILDYDIVSIDEFDALYALLAVKGHHHFYRKLADTREYHVVQLKSEHH